MGSLNPTRPKSLTRNSASELLSTVVGYPNLGLLYFNGLGSRLLQFHGVPTGLSGSEALIL